MKPKATLADNDLLPNGLHAGIPTELEFITDNIKAIYFSLGAEGPHECCLYRQLYANRDILCRQNANIVAH